LNSPDEPQKKVDSLRKNIEEVDKEARKARSEYLANGRAVAKLKAEMDRTQAEIEKLKRGNVPQADGETDPEFERKEAELNQKLLDLRQGVQTNVRELSEAEYEYEVWEPFYRKGNVPEPNWKKIVTRLGYARDAVRADEQRIAAVEAERRKLRPG